MDPFRNFALQNSKLQSLLQDQQASTTSSSDMPPPAYHKVVDPTAPLPNMHNPYDADDEEKDDDIPEINVNAMTQVRGHGNIISVAQMDSVRIANLIVALLHGSPSESPPQATDAGLPAQTSQTDMPRTESSADRTEQSSAHRTQNYTQRSRASRRDSRQIPKVNVTVNCGATIIGDRNIVGPGLGDIARHMQMVQRNQMAQRLAQQQQQQQQMNANRAAGIPSAGLGFPVNGQVPMPTPPMSRCSSFESQGSNGVKRKVEESIETNDAKRTC